MTQQTTGAFHFFDFHHRVRDDEMDRQGHVSNLRYISWTLGAAEAHSASLGWTDDRRIESECDWVVRNHNITYKAAAFAGDRVVVRTWIADIGHVASRRGYLICRLDDNTLLARGETKWAFVSLRKRKAVPIPQDLVSAFRILRASPPLPWK